MSAPNNDDPLVNFEDTRVKSLLDKLKVQERDALFRFYCLNETPEQIHWATGITGPELQALRSKIRVQFRALRNPRPQG